MHASLSLAVGIRRVALAAGLLFALVAVSSCRARRGRGPRGAVVVTRSGKVDEAATTLARAIDARLGGTCPRRIALPEAAPSPPVATDARTVAETCVRAGAHLQTPARLERARPFSSGLVEVAVLAATKDDAEAVTLRSLARLAFARGLLAAAALRPAGSAIGEAFQPIEESPPATLDDETRRAIAFVVVDHLLSREGIDGRAVVALTARTAELGVDAALERAPPPLQTDVETLFASVRASCLSFHAPRAPVLSTVELLGDKRLLAQFDAKLRPTPTSLLICGERYDGSPTPEGDALTVSFDDTRCLEVDGLRVVAIEIGGLSTSPRGLDGAIVRRTFARAESDPAIAAGADGQ